MPVDLETNPVLHSLRQFDSGAVERAEVFRGELTVFVQAGRLRQVCEFLRDEPGLSFKYLSDVTAVDRYPSEPRFEIVYHLLSLETGERLRLKAPVPGDDPRIESMTPVWPGAEAFECEMYDLFGIYFEGHPDLHRILLPDDWEGHPLRKDYTTEGYR